MTTEGISYDAAVILSSYSFDGLKHYRLSNLDRLNTSTTRVALVQDINKKRYNILYIYIYIYIYI